MNNKFKLTPAEQHSLAAHTNWSEWGQRLGIALYGSNDEHVATFILSDGSHWNVPKLAREAIDRANGNRCDP